MPEETSPMPTVTRIKEGISLLKEFVILLAIVLLLVYPKFIGNIADQAGLKSAFGMEFYDQLQQSGKETDNAQEALDALTNEVTQLKNQLQSLSRSAESTSNPGKFKQDIDNLANNAVKLERKSNEIKPFLSRSKNIQRDIMGRMANKK